MSTLQGLTIAFTGKFQRHSRYQYANFIKGAGGKTCCFLADHTDLLLCGEKAGAKLQKAQKLGIETISENELCQRLGLG